MRDEIGNRDAPWLRNPSLLFHIPYLPTPPCLTVPDLNSYSLITSPVSSESSAANVTSVVS